MRAQLTRVMQFVGPRVAKEIILGADQDTALFGVNDCVGFSATAAGLLHYDTTREDPAMDTAT